MAKKSPSCMFRRTHGQAFTRKSSDARKNYIGGVPASRITQFDVGNLSGDFPLAVELIVTEECLIRHMAMEAARVTANRVINKVAGRQGYHLKFHLYPHHVLRHNKQASGAGADRVSQGMRKAFGKNVGSAARVKAGQRVMTLYTLPQHLDKARDAMRKAGHKLPSPIKIKVREMKTAA